MLDEPPFWSLPQIIAWIVTRENAWIGIAADLEADVSEKGQSEMLLGHLRMQLARHFSNLDRSVSGFWEQAISEMIQAHENGDITLSGRLNFEQESKPIPREALDGGEVFVARQFGPYLAPAGKPTNSLPKWHHVRAMSKDVRQAFPRPPEPQIATSWTALEDESSPHVDLLAAVDWLARHHVAGGNRDCKEGPHLIVDQQGNENSLYSYEQWEKAKTLLRHHLQAGVLSATGRSTSSKERKSIPTDFWQDALFDEFYSDAFDPSERYGNFDGEKAFFPANTGWKKIRLAKSDVLNSWPDPTNRRVALDISVLSAPQLPRGRRRKQNLVLDAIHTLYPNGRVPQMKRDALVSIINEEIKRAGHKETVRRDTVDRALGFRKS